MIVYLSGPMTGLPDLNRPAFFEADIALTQTLQQALGLLDIDVLDHLIVAQGQFVSLAQRGLLHCAKRA